MRIPRPLRRAARRMQHALTPRPAREAPMAMRPGPEGHAVAGAAEVLDRTGLAPLRDTVAERTPGERAFVLLDLSDHDAVDGEAVTAIAEAVAHARRDGVGLAIMPPPAAVASYVLNAGDPGELTFLPELRAA